MAEAPPEVRELGSVARNLIREACAELSARPGAGRIIPFPSQASGRCRLCGHSLDGAGGRLWAGILTIACPGCGAGQDYLITKEEA